MLLKNMTGKEVREDRKREGWEFANRVVREGLTKKAILKQKLEGVSLGQSSPNPSSQPTALPCTPCPKVKARPQTSLN